MNNQLLQEVQEDVVLRTPLMVGGSEPGKRAKPSRRLSGMRGLRKRAHVRHEGRRALEGTLAFGPSAREGRSGSVAG